MTVAVSALLIVSLLAAPAFAAGMYIEDPNTANTFTAADGDGNISYNFKGDGGAWLNIMNPWGESAYMVIEPGQGFVQSLIVTFEVEGYDGGDDGYRVMAGFGINGWSPSVWALGAERDDTISWEEIFGEEYFYCIDGDGVYQLIISFRHAMDYFEEHNDWYIKDFLEGIDCLELGIFDPPQNTTMKVTILGLEETGDIFSLENISRPLGSGKFFAESVGDLPPLPPTEPPREPRIGEEDGNDGDGNNGGAESSPAPSPTPEEPEDTTAGPDPGDAAPPASNGGNDDEGLDIWLWVIIGGGVVIVAVVLIVVLARKKK
jgi:hypothetical protein